jgi:predicted GNAT family acetyltransferase
MPSPSVPVRHAPESHRFEALVDGHLARLDYEMEGDTMNLHHTGVPPELEGRGIASALVRAAVEHVRAEGLGLRPTCGYVRAWMGRHPEHGDLVR